MNDKRYTVLCYIVNGYEKVHEIKEKDPECEYLLITDDPKLESSTWKVIYDGTLLNTKSIFDRCYSIRFNLFKYATTNICIYVDANIQINRSLNCLIDKFETGHYDMALMPHPLNSTFMPEYKLWIQMRNYPVEQANKFFSMLVTSHYDMTYKSLFQGCFKIVRRGKLNDDFDRLTLAFLKYLGTETQIERLDQTVYSYVLNAFFNTINVFAVSEQIVRSSYMTWYWHNSDKPNLNFFMVPGKPDYKFVFNKQVECFQLF